MIRILIADPDSAARRALTRLLQRRLVENHIVEVGDVETLITRLAGESPDLLLLDWQLYGSPAPDTCRLLQRAYPQLKIVLLSVKAEDAALAHAAGADFIYKGASPDELLATLTQLLGREPTLDNLRADQSGTAHDGK